MLVALKLTKAAPLASMVITSLTYSFFFGWPYAIGMVGLVVAHECGNGDTLRSEGTVIEESILRPCNRNASLRDSLLSDGLNPIHWGRSRGWETGYLQ